jgi:hypothetical protein
MRGANARDRTEDLHLTKMVHYHCVTLAYTVCMAEGKGFEPLCALQRPVISNQGHWAGLWQPSGVFGGGDWLRSNSNLLQRQV